MLLSSLMWCIQVIITPFNELEENEFLDPRTAQVAIIDNIKQVRVQPESIPIE